MNENTTNELIDLNGFSFFDPLNDSPDDLPDESGLYMLCAKTDASIELCSGAQFSYIAGNAIMYIGISAKKGLRHRDYQNHFRGTARNSTVRKSLGALFGWRSERIIYSNGKYRFSSDREQELSRWMKENLVMIYWCMPANDICSIETCLINEFSPPLNIAKNHSEANRDFRKRLSNLRN